MYMYMNGGPGALLASSLAGKGRGFRSSSSSSGGLLGLCQVGIDLGVSGHERERERERSSRAFSVGAGFGVENTADGASVSALTRSKNRIFNRNSTAMNGNNSATNDTSGSSSVQGNDISKRNSRDRSNNNRHSNSDSQSNRHSHSHSHSNSNSNNISNSITVAGSSPRSSGSRNKIGPNPNPNHNPDRPFSLPPGKFRPKQSLGQNFLSDQNYVIKIVDSMPGDLSEQGHKVSS